MVKERGTEDLVLNHTKSGRAEEREYGVPLFKIQKRELEQIHVSELRFLLPFLSAAIQEQ